MSNYRLLFIATTVASTLALTGCSTPTTVIDAKDQSSNIVAGLSYADFNGASSILIDDLNASPGFDRADGSRIIVYMGNIENDTMQRIDTDQLAKGLRVKMLRSGKFAMTTAFGEDSATKDFRDLKDSDMVDQSTVNKGQTVIAPDFSMTGKILERTNRLDNGDTRLDYYFQLSLTHLKTGIAYWEGEEVVGKIADGSSVNW
ncbi:membrane protein [Vibrio sp. qd031]|uniref:penicillin-binding protein activator LpoB n=1 Tax=Vibrio sp. qd031 TaxID=1603038 RepID=UPI000A12099F|nr:penicillin-binding protein activator LpoB [Vibrio sp. qd031]ORT48266.1 membrane protein [Vibrio sp. qd031]